MSEKNQPVAELMNQANQALGVAQGVLDFALADLKEKSLQNGRISAARMDQHQLACYDLSLSCAEATGARFMLDYAAKVRDEAGNPTRPVILEERLALLFCAEAIHSIRSRLAARPEDFGLSLDRLGRLESGAALDFCRAQLTARNIAQLGQDVAALDGQVGAYMLDDQHTMMQDTFRRVANDVVMPLAKEVHQKDLIIPDAILEQVKDLGCFGLSIPERFGGLQSDEHEDNMGMIVVTEELSRGSLGAAGSLITRPEILSRALLKGGTEEQKQQWLPQLASGELLCAVAVTEPNYGSDVASMRQLKAAKVDGGWVLNGNKTWCTFGGKAGVLLTLARTNPDLSLGHRGLSIFLVEKDSYDGHEFTYKQPNGGTLSGKAISTIGYRGMHSFEMFFDDVFVPDSNLLGGPAGEGKGFYNIMAGFAGGRIQTAARAIGVMQAAFERAVAYAKERVVFDHPIGNYQLTQVKLARLAAYLATSRQFTYGVGRLMDKGEGDMEASMVKIFTCKTAEWFTREAMQIHGGMGYAEDTPVSRYFVDARVLSIFEGAEETLALKVISRSLVENAKDKKALEA